MKQRIAIYGAGGFGREVLMLINQINESQELWEFIGFFDDGKSKGEIINGYEVLGRIDDLNKYPSRLGLVLSLGDPGTKEKILSGILNKNIYFPILIHPNSNVKPYQFLEIGEGTIICAGNIITTNIKIGKHVILNLGCTIGHDTVIGDFSSFMPYINISGECKIGKGVYVGTAAAIINQIEIGDYTIIGAGSVVTKNLPSKCTAVGIPAKPIKFHEQ